MTGDVGALFGKFRGTVTANQDPIGLGRIKARVPALIGWETTGWALPCSPPGFFAVPAIGAGVWIEFEQGDPQFPIWTGCWWGAAAEMPPGFSPDPQRVLLHNGSGQTIALTGTGIEIYSGGGAVVVLQGPTVSLNGGALEVT